MTIRKRTIVFIIAITSVLACILLFFFYSRHPLDMRIQIKNSIIHVTLAVTIKEIQQGLSDHEPLKDTEGMLFVFSLKQQYPFWMKGMRFPLDLIWLADKKIIQITENVPVPTNDGTPLPVYVPEKPVDMVLEVNAGTAATNQWKVGDTLTVLR